MTRTLRLGLALSALALLLSNGHPTTAQTTNVVQVQSNAANLATLAEQQTQSGDLAAIRTATETIDNAINGSGFNISKIGGSDPVAALCDDPAKVAHKNINATINGNGEIVPLSGSQVVYVCGYNIGVSAAATLQWIYGTGVACATGETDMETWIFDANLGFGAANPNGGAIQFKTTAGQALCVETSVSVTVFGRVSYVQQ